MYFEFLKRTVPLWSVVAILLAVIVWRVSKDVQSAILAGTAVLIGWYSWETFRLRQEMARQSDLQEMPILNLYFGGLNLDLKNVSHVSAYDIRIDPIRYAEYSLVFSIRGQNPILEPGGEFKQIAAWTQAADEKTIFSTLVPLGDYLRQATLEKGEDRFDEVFVDLHVHYKNMRGQKFSGHYRISMPNPYSDDMRISLIGFSKEAR